MATCLFGMMKISPVVFIVPLVLLALLVLALVVVVVKVIIWACSPRRDNPDQRTGGAPADRAGRDVR
jgi:hypothetical protein